MLKLTWFEIKKLLGKKWLWILLAAVILLENQTVIVTAVRYSENLRYQRNVLQNYSEFGGALTEEKYNRIQSELSAAEKEYNEDLNKALASPGKFMQTRAEDYTFLIGLKSQAEYILKADKDARAVVEQANLNDSLFSESGNAYKANQNKLIASTFPTGLNLDLLPGEGTLLRFGVDMNLLIILLVFFLYPIFSGEHENRLYPILFSTVRGRRRVVFSKALAAVCVAAGVYLLSALSRCAFEAPFGGFHCFGAPVQSLQYFARCPFPLTIGGCFLLQCALQCFGFLVFALLCTFLSSLFRQSYFSLALSLLLGLSVYGVYSFLMNPSASLQIHYPEDQFRSFFSFVRRWLFFGLFKPEVYFTGFLDTRIGPFSVFAVLTAAAASLLFAVLFIALTYLIYTRQFQFSLRFHSHKRVGKTNAVSI